MTHILLSGLVIAAVCAFLVWWLHYRVQQEADRRTVHGQLATMRTALRDAGIPLPDDPPEVVNPAPPPRIAPAGPPRHAAKGAQR